MPYIQYAASFDERRTITRALMSQASLPIAATSVFEASMSWAAPRVAMAAVVAVALALV